MASSLSACTHNTLTFRKILAETPEVSKTNVSTALSCMSDKLKKLPSKQAYVFMVREMEDGTVKKGVYQNSPLSDSGQLQLTNIISSSLYPHLGLVTDTFPMIFKPYIKEDLGLNRIGLPSQQNTNSFLAAYGRIISGSRQQKKMPPLSNDVTPLIVTGAFTRFDTDNIFQQGGGQNLGTRATSGQRNSNGGSGTTDIGETNSSKAISLVVNLVDPRYNIVVASESFDLMYHRKNKTFRLRAAIGDAFYGMSRNNIVVESTHAAQKTLVDAAGLWVLNKAYGEQGNFVSCFTDKQKKMVSL